MLDVTKQAYNDRLKYAIWCSGHYFLCCGRKEIAFCKWGQVRFCELLADGVKKEYVEVNHLWDKSHQCKFKNTKPRDKYEACPRIYANDNDELCPYRFMKFFRSLCVQSQERVLCFAATDKQMKKWKKTNQPYLYNPKTPVGENTVGPLCKEMTEEMGFEEYQKCTGHGLRKMGISHAMTNTPTSAAPIILKASRHKRYQTSLLYQRPNDDMYHNYSAAILGSRKKRRKNMNAVDTLTKESDDEINEHEFVRASNDDDDPGLATKPSGVEVMTTAEFLSINRTKQYEPKRNNRRFFHM